TRPQHNRRRLERLLTNPRTDVQLSLDFRLLLLDLLLLAKDDPLDLVEGAGHPLAGLFDVRANRGRVFGTAYLLAHTHPGSANDSTEHEADREDGREASGWTPTDLHLDEGTRVQGRRPL